MSDVPLGMFLSGGLDSSIVATIAGQLKPGLAAYTVRLPSHKFDESAIATEVAKHAGLKHHIVDVTEGDAAALADVLQSFDEPFADSSLLPTYMISKAIRQEVTVALSGDGGDELFAGYDIYDRVLRERVVDRIPVSIRSAIAPFHRLLKVGTPGKNFLRRLPLSPDERFLLLYRSPEELSGPVLRQDLQSEVDRVAVDGVRRSLLGQLAENCRSVLQRMTLVDGLTYLPDDVLAKVDRASMLASLEVRCPLLDHRIVEFAYRLPDRLRYFNGVRKVVLKAIGKQILPDGFPFDQKRGFNIPEADWIRGRWRAMVEDVMNASSLLDRKAAQAILRDHDDTGRHSRTLFKLFALALFERHSGISFA